MRARRLHVLTLASALVHRGREPASVTGLAALVEPAALRESLRFVLDRGGGRPTPYLQQLAVTALAVARHWAHVPTAQEKALQALVRRCDPGGPPGLTAKNRAALRQGFARYLPLGGLVGIWLTIEMVFVSASVARDGAAGKVAGGPQAASGDVTNIETIGRVLYTDYIYFFQAAGIVLLIAMIGAIVLTLRHKPGVRRQKIHDDIHDQKDFQSAPKRAELSDENGRRGDRTLGILYYALCAGYDE